MNHFPIENENRIQKHTWICY